MQPRSGGTKVLSTPPGAYTLRLLLANAAWKRTGVTIAAAITFTGCSYNWTQVVPMGRSMIPHPGSAVVTIVYQDMRTTLHHDAWAWLHHGDADSVVEMKRVVTGYHHLDVQICKTSSRAPFDPGGGNPPVGEQDRLGPVRFQTGEDGQALVATNEVTGQTWRVAGGFGKIESVTAVPAVRRVLLGIAKDGTYVYDAQTNRSERCP